MKIDIVRNLTKSNKRKSLFHFTRASNLNSIYDFDSLYASYDIVASPSGKRRVKAEEINIDGHSFTLNAHLHLANWIMDSDTSVIEFRTFLDQNVFLWPTLRLCQEMAKTYIRREPTEKFIVLRFDAIALLLDYFENIKLSKYDAGSMPRYPNRSSYKKTIRMFLPLDQFGTTNDCLVPRIPSEIHEILVFNGVKNLSNYLQCIYCQCPSDIPSNWRILYNNWSNFLF